MRRIAALVLLVGVVQGCTAHACTDVGGGNGLSVSIPPALHVKTGEVRVEVCDRTDCQSAIQRLGRLPRGPVGRGADFSFETLGRRFEPGRVRVTVTLTDANGTQVAFARRDVTFSRTYPNGKACDGDGYVHGSLDLTRQDRVS